MPGVPPNAIATLKDAFKNLLRPNRRRRQQEQQAQQEQQNQQGQQAQAAQTQTEQTGSANQPDVPSTIPPTHPLATGQHSEPQTTLPMPGAAAAAAAAAPAAVVAGSEGVTNEQAKKESEDRAPVSPVGPAPVAKDEEPKSEPVSAVSAEHNKPVTPPKTDGANDLRFDPPLHFPPTAKASIPATSENAKPSVNEPATTTAPATAANAPTPTSETQPATKTSFESARDEKMPVMAEEPPEIKAKAAAPGMSATSGPLDDFPIEDDKP